MHKHPHVYLICSILTLTTCVYSCKGQVNTELRVDSVDGQNTITVEQALLTKIKGTETGANVHCVLQDKAGNLWFGTTGAGVYRFNGTSFTHFTVQDGLCNNDVWCMYEDKNGILWFGTNDGICFYDGKSLTGLPITISDAGNFDPNIDPSIENAVWSIFQDKTGKFWFGTSKGMYRYDGASFSQFLYQDDIQNPNGLHLRHIQSIVEDKKGNIWFASWNQEGAACFDGKTVTAFRPNGDGMVHAILEDRKGNIWFGTRNSGACYYDGNAFTYFPDIESFSNNCIYSMAEDEAGNIWFCTESAGVWCYQSSDTLLTAAKKFANFTVNDGLVHNSVFSVTIDKSGALWFGTRGIGLCRYDGKQFTPFSE